MNEFPACAICYREHGPFSKCDFETLYNNVINGYRAYKSQNAELTRKLEILKDCMNDLMKDWHPNLSDGAYYHIKEALAKIKET